MRRRCVCGSLDYSPDECPVHAQAESDGEDLRDYPDLASDDECEGRARNMIWRD